MLNQPQVSTRSPSIAPFYLFFGEGSPTKIDYGNKKGTLILTCLLEDLEHVTAMVMTGWKLGCASPCNHGYIIYNLLTKLVEHPSRPSHPRRPLLEVPKREVVEPLPYPSKKLGK